MDWKREIFVAQMVKQKVAEVDTQGLWEYPHPELAAGEQDVSLVENAIGCPLNIGHRGFLLHANGWKSFFQAVDVLSTADLIGGPRLTRAMELLTSCEDLHDLCGFKLGQLLPIAVSADDTDVFAITKSTSNAPGNVFWFSGQLIDEFSCFEEWFLSMVDYSRREYTRMLEGR